MTVSRRTVLVISDGGPDSTDLLCRLIRLAGCKTLVSASTQEAIDFVTTQNVDSVVIDWSAINEAGIGICRALKAAHTRAPIFFFAPVRQQETTDKVLSSGAREVFAKPDGISELIRTVSLAPRADAASGTESNQD